MCYDFTPTCVETTDCVAYNVIGWSGIPDQKVINWRVLMKAMSADRFLCRGRFESVYDCYSFGGGDMYALVIPYNVSYPGYVSHLYKNEYCVSTPAYP